MQHVGSGSHGLLNVVIQDTALKGRAKRPFLVCANLRHRTVGVFKPTAASMRSVLLSTQTRSRQKCEGESMDGGID